MNVVNRFSITTVCLCLQFLCGCFTVNETPAPTLVAPTCSHAATNITLAVRGFAATLTEYVTATSYQTIYCDGYHRGGFATAQATTVIPYQCPSDRFLEQARNRLECCGFNLNAQTPDYIVEAHFLGPVTTSGDTAASVAWFLCSLLTCDYGAQTWHSRLKIYDNRSGRLAFNQDYTQKYEVLGFSPIPLFGISAYECTSPNYMQCWCLGVLTERMAIDAASWLCQNPAP